MTRSLLAASLCLTRGDPQRATLGTWNSLIKAGEDDIASPDEQQAARRDIQALLILPGLNDEQLRTWASGCLLAAPFTNSVMRLHGMETPNASRILAKTYGLNVSEARRDMETVQNWLAFLTPEVN